MSKNLSRNNSAHEKLVIHEEKVVTKVRCYYCHKYTFDLDKFIKHLNWHHSLATTAKDNQLPYERITKDSKEKSWFCTNQGWEDNRS